MLTIELKNLGSFLHTRFDAATIREKIVTAWKSGESLVLDFDKVEMISPSFADECFGKLVNELNLSAGEVEETLKFKNLSPIISMRIRSAFVERTMSRRRAYA
jgi:hypothetical protein